MIVKLAEARLKTKFGEFQEHLYYDGQQEIIAISMGSLKDAEEVLCRVHSSCIYAHHFNSIECDCREQMELTQQMIQKAGRGIIVWLEQEGKANGHLALIKSKELKEKGMGQADAYEAIGFKRDARDFTRAAEIIKDLGVKSIRMVSNNPKKIGTLSQHGINVVGIQEILIESTPDSTLRKTLEDKRQEGHLFNLE